jgi:hypothetical protein
MLFTLQTVFVCLLANKCTGKLHRDNPHTPNYVTSGYMLNSWNTYNLKHFNFWLVLNRISVLMVKRCPLSHLPNANRKGILFTPWSESASELYRPRDRHLSAKLVPSFADRGCHVVRVTDPYGRNLGFLDWSLNFFYQVAPQLYSLGWVDPFSEPLLLRKFGSDGNRTRTPGSVARNSDH